MTQTPTPLLVERSVLARVLGCSVRTVAALEAESVIVPTERGKGRRPSMYELEAVVPAFVRYRESLVTGHDVKPKDRKDLSIAALNELKLAREQGDVFPKDAVIRAGRAVIDVVRTRLLRLPADLRRLGAVADDNDEARVEGAVREALEELARLELVI